MPPTQLLLTASVKGMTTLGYSSEGRGLPRRKLGAGTVMLELLRHPQPCRLTQVEGPCTPPHARAPALPPGNPRCHLLPRELRPSFPPKGHPALETTPP